MAAENLDYILARLRSVTPDDHPFLGYFEEERGTPTPTELINAFGAALAAMADFVEVARGHPAVKASGAVGMLRATVTAIDDADWVDQILAAQDAQISAAVDDIVAGLGRLLASETGDA